MNGYTFTAIICLVSFFIFGYISRQIINNWLKTEEERDKFLKMPIEKQAEIIPKSFTYILWARILCISIGFTSFVWSFF